MFFFIWKNIDLLYFLDPIQYEFWFLYTTLADPEQEPKLKIYQLQLSPKVSGLLAAPAPQNCIWVFYRE